MKIKRFKLTSMASAVINSKEMVSLIGGAGTDCSCSCYYENQGGASTNDNKNGKLCSWLRLGTS